MPTHWLQRLSEGVLTITAELDPPRGADSATFLQRANDLAPRVDAINITDSPTARVRMSSIIAGHLLQTHTGRPAIAHVAGRDRNRIGLQAELLGAAALGVHHLLLLTGDDPTVGDHPEAKAVFDLDASGLLDVCASFANGKTLGGTDLDAPIEFVPGVAANPGNPDADAEVAKLAGRVEKGARFVQTQPVFEPSVVERFEDALERAGLNVPILYGIMPLRSHRAALAINNIPGINVPQGLIDRVQDGGEEAGVNAARELVRELAPMVKGLHLFPMGSVRIAGRVLDVLEEGGWRERLLKDS